MRAVLLTFVLLFAMPASAPLTRVFAPVVGQSLMVDALRLDVIDVRATRWQPPPGVSVLHYAMVRTADRGESRTLTLSANPNRLDVLGDHAIRLLEQPLRISVEPAPRLAVDERTAARAARTKVAALGWASSPLVSRSVLVRGTTWEISFQLAADLDAIVRVDSTTGQIVEASKRGGF